MKKPKEKAFERYMTRHDGAFIGADRVPTRIEMQEGPFRGDESLKWCSVSIDEYHETVMDCRFENGEWIQ